MFEVTIEVEPTSKEQGISPLDFLTSLKEWLSKLKKEGKIDGYTMSVPEESTQHWLVVESEGMPHLQEIEEGQK